MATMREMVSERVERFEKSHSRVKHEARFGWLIAPTTLLVGWVVLVVGIITIPLPGQGWLTTFLGVGILSLEVAWARNLLTWGVRIYDSFFHWFGNQSRAVRWSLIAALILIIWITFMVLGWAGWALGGLDFLTPLYGDWLGLTRFQLLV